MTTVHQLYTRQTDGQHTLALPVHATALRAGT